MEIGQVSQGLNKVGSEMDLTMKQFISGTLTQNSKLDDRQRSSVFEPGN